MTYAPDASGRRQLVDSIPMRLNRIYCEGPLADPARSADATIALPSAGAYHAVRVLRLREGAPLILFDGSGIDHQAEIVRVEGDKVSVRLGSSTPGTAESPLRITLVQGI